MQQENMQPKTYMNLTREPKMSEAIAGKIEKKTGNMIIMAVFLLHQDLPTWATSTPRL